jgi:hypothetical protein
MGGQAAVRATPRESGIVGPLACALSDTERRLLVCESETLANFHEGVPSLINAAMAVVIAARLNRACRAVNAETSVVQKREERRTFTWRAVLATMLSSLTKGLLLPMRSQH